jgi:WhiB family redox-sensing transcriptional regulator
MPHARRLPKPTNEAWARQTHAACRGMPTTYFFHPWGERGADRETRIQRAKEVCSHCPVIQACQWQALEVQEMYGIWGGLSEDERLILLNRHRTILRLPIAPEAALEVTATTRLHPKHLAERPDRSS